MKYGFYRLYCFPKYSPLMHFYMRLSIFTCLFDTVKIAFVICDFILIGGNSSLISRSNCCYMTCFWGKPNPKTGICVRDNKSKSMIHWQCCYTFLMFSVSKLSFLTPAVSNSSPHATFLIRHLRNPKWCYDASISRYMHSLSALKIRCRSNILSIFD